MSTKKQSVMAYMEHVEAIAADAGERTGVRIVPVVVKASGRYERAEELIGLWAAAVALSLIWLFFRHADIGRHWPSLEAVWYGGVLPVLTTLAIGFGLGALLTTQMAYIRRWFVPRRQLDQNVRLRAAKALEDAHARYRDDRPAETLVLFVSLFEKAAVVLPGEAVAAQLPAEKLAAMQQQLSDGVKAGEVQEAISQSIRTAVSMLAPYFPPRQAKGHAIEPLQMAAAN